MTLPRPVSAVVFDMDGLLIDSERLMLQAMQGAAVAMGRDMPFPVFQSMVGLTHAQSDGILIDHFGHGFVLDDYVTEVRARFVEAHKAGVALKAGVIEMLDHLDHVGAPRAVATSSRMKSVETHLGHAGLLSRFDAFITAESVTNGKPHPEPYLKAAAALGLDPRDCIALEDSHNGVRAAAAAGMMTIMVPDMLEPNDEMRGLCVRIAQDLHEVRDLLAVMVRP
ncbi:MAG: HAD superfamily hydrolase (TIGR01509 family) [Pseudoalteromonas distincta]|jgi:HAD superfamily hydrolase (TIGR01509 family)